MLVSTYPGYKQKKSIALLLYSTLKLSLKNLLKFFVLAYNCIYGRGLIADELETSINKDLFFNSLLYKK